jgi:hypothetical protein
MRRLGQLPMAFIPGDGPGRGVRVVTVLLD